MYLVLCRKIHAVTNHHKGTAVTAYGYDQDTMSRSAEMSGNIRPTDMAAVFAPISNSLSSSLKWAFYGRINE